MCKYLCNIWLAICGRNPFDEELVRAKKDYDERLRKETFSMQRLVENLRERVWNMEDNVRMTNECMRLEIGKANATIGRLMQEKQVLEQRIAAAASRQEDNFNLD